MDSTLNFDYNSWVTQFIAYIGPFIGIFILFFAVILIIQIVIYVIQAIGLYTLAKNKDDRCSILAWIPILNWFILGKLIDEKVKLGSLELKKAHIWMPVAEGVFLMVSIVTQVISLAGNNMYLTGAGYADSGFIMVTSLFTILISLISIVWAVLQYAAYYRLYKIYAPENAVLYLVLSIFFRNLLIPIFIFVIRNRKPQLMD